MLDFQTEARLFPALFPRWTSKCEDAVHWRVRSSLRGTQELPQQPFFLWVPVISPSRSQPVLATQCQQISEITHWHFKTAYNCNYLLSLSLMLWATFPRVEHVHVCWLDVYCTRCSLHISKWCFCCCLSSAVIRTCSNELSFNLHIPRQLVETLVGFVDWVKHIQIFTMHNARLPFPLYLTSCCVQLCRSMWDTGRLFNHIAFQAVFSSAVC